MDHLAPNLPLSLDRRAGAPAYRQLARQVAALVRDGRLAPGDRLPGERELAASIGVARGTVQKAILELLRQGVVESVHGSGTYVAGLPPAESGPVRIAGVDCNPEALAGLARQVRGLPHATIDAVDLDALRDGARPAGSLAGYDLLLTTTTHDAELRRLVPALAERVLPTAVAPARGTVVEMARIPIGVAIGIVCRSERFRRIIEDNLAGLGHDVRDAGFLAEDTLVRDGAPTASGPSRLAAFLDGTAVVVVPPDSPLLAPPVVFREALAAFAAAGGRVVPFEYQMERGSLVHLEEAVERIRSRRPEREGRRADG